MNPVDLSLKPAQFAAEAAKQDDNHHHFTLTFNLPPYPGETGPSPPGDAPARESVPENEALGVTGWCAIRAVQGLKRAFARKGIEIKHGPEVDQKLYECVVFEAWAAKCPSSHTAFVFNTVIPFLLTPPVLHRAHLSDEQAAQMQEFLSYAFDLSNETFIWARRSGVYHHFRRSLIVDLRRQWGCAAEDMVDGEYGKGCSAPLERMGGVRVLHMAIEKALVQHIQPDKPGMAEIAAAVASSQPPKFAIDLTIEKMEGDVLAVPVPSG